MRARPRAWPQAWRGRLRSALGLLLPSAAAAKRWTNAAVWGRRCGDGGLRERLGLRGGVPPTPRRAPDPRRVRDIGAARLAAGCRLLGGAAEHLEFRGRQRLGSEGDFREVVQEFEADFDEIRRSGEGDRISFDDFDISQHSLDLAQHRAIAQLLGRANVRVQRLRLFGSPGLGDAAIGLLADLLRRVSAANAPTELHLSDCAFGNAGLRDLVVRDHGERRFPSPGRRFALSALHPPGGQPRGRAGDCEGHRGRDGDPYDH